MKTIAWGCSKLLELYLKNGPSHKIDYIVDNKAAQQQIKFNGLDVVPPGSLIKEKMPFQVIIFAVSSPAIQSILLELNNMGLRIGEGVSLYSDLFYPSYVSKAKEVFGDVVNEGLHSLSKSFNLNSRIPVHTTILGNTLFLEALSRSTGAIAEVGSFNGGNAILAAQYMANHEERPFYAFDSYEGFPALSEIDPQTSKRGDYITETSYENVLDNFSMFPFVHIVKGFVPATFRELPEEKYGLVFYDCDLYQPALDTFAYFWDRMLPGGFLLIHDYMTEEGGFVGVKKATDEFFGPKNIKIHQFWENTIGLVMKPGKNS